MNKPLILCVEDDSAIHNLITMTLETNQYKFVAATNGNDALIEARTRVPDLVLLDLGLPDMDGIEVIKAIREWSLMPIIVISARSDDSDKIEALNAGADDYLVKPFSVDEMLARINAMLRRMNFIQNSTGEVGTVFTNGSLKIDFAAGIVYFHDEELHLTPIEYKLLCLLAKNLGKVLTRTYITEQVWGNSRETNIASLRVFMVGLRKKLSEEDEDDCCIQTYIGIGYRMVKV